MSLERLVQSRFLRPIVTGVLASIIGCASPTGGKGLREACGNDSECSGQYVCDAKKCVGSSGASCGNDYDCSSVYVCEQGMCVVGSGSGSRGKADGYSGQNTTTNSLPLAKTPQEAYSAFMKGLQSNNLETAVQYISPHVREKYKGMLSGVTLSQLAEKFPSLEGQNPVSTVGSLRQYEFQYKGEGYAILFQCHDEECTILGF